MLPLTPITCIMEDNGMYNKSVITMKYDAYRDIH